MYRYYSKGDYKIMEYDFYSINEFIDYLDNTPTNTDIWGGNDRYLASNTNDYDFCKTYSLEEAKEYCKFGYHEDFDKLVELKLSLEKFLKMSIKKNKQYNFYVGYAPDVKAYLEGNPLSMLNKQNPRRQAIDIYYNVSVSGSTSTQPIFNRGVITLCLVELLEKMGFSVGLNIFEMSTCCEQIFYAKFHLKQNGERLNVQKLYFPLCHPSFLRRLVFRLQEQTPDITSDWSMRYYGKPARDYTIRKVINLKENDIVIDEPFDMKVGGKDLIEDANDMFEVINGKCKTKDFELPHLQKVRR